MPSIVLIDELWILTTEGETILNEKRDLDVDEQLFGGLLVAINSFLQEVGMDQCQSIVTSSTRLSILYSEDHELIFIARSKLNIAEKEVIDKLIQIKSKFLTYYKKLQPYQALMDKKIKSLFYSVL